MLKVTIENLDPDGRGRRRIVASMSISDAPGHEGQRRYEVTILQAEDPLVGQPPRMWACTMTGPPDASSIWPRIRAAIDAMADAECACL